MAFVFFNLPWFWVVVDVVWLYGVAALFACFCCVALFSFFFFPLCRKLTQEEYERQEKEQKLSAADEKAVLAIEEVKVYK